MNVEKLNKRLQEFKNFVSVGMFPSLSPNIFTSIK